MTQDKIFLTAKACLGLHMTLDNSVAEENGCVEAVSAVLKRAGVTMPLKGLQAVNELIPYLLGRGWQEIAVPQYGCVVTAHSPNHYNAQFAHTGIILKYGIANNNSNTGLFTETYTVESWNHYFHDLHGSDVRYFAPPQ